MPVDGYDCDIISQCAYLNRVSLCGFARHWWFLWGFTPPENKKGHTHTFNKLSAWPYLIFYINGLVFMATESKTANHCNRKYLWSGLEKKVTFWDLIVIVFFVYVNVFFYTETQASHALIHNQSITQLDHEHTIVGS